MTEDYFFGKLISIRFWNLFAKDFPSLTPENCPLFLLHNLGRLGKFYFLVQTNNPLAFHRRN